MNLYLSILANLIIKQYFDQSNCLLIFNNSEKNFNYNGILPFVPFETNTNLNESLIFRYFGCHGIIIIDDNPRQIFEDFEAIIKLTNVRFNYRKYLILPTGNPKEIMNIFNSSYLDFVADFLVVNRTHARHGNLTDILSVREDVYDLYTHQYTGLTDNRKIVNVDRWFSKNLSFLLDADLYQDKLNNQKGRPLRIAMFTYKPYSIADPTDGTEVLVALEVAKKYNMTPQLVVDEIGEWGEVFDNWTGSGIIGNVATDRSDIGLGALYTWEHEYYFLDISKPGIRTGITCIAPSPRLISGWMTPFISFSTKMWLVVATSFLVAFISIFAVFTYDSLTSQEKNRKQSSENAINSFLLTEAIFLLQGLTKMPHEQSSRVVFGLILLLSLMVASMYSCGLASNMTVPRYSGTIKNAKDLADSGLSWGATSTAWISSIEGDTSYIYKTLVDNFHVLSKQQLLEKNSENFAFSVERLHGGNFAIGNYITPDGVQMRRLMDQDIYWEFCVIMLRKSSILLPYIDQVILEIAQTGLPYIWEYQVVNRNSDTDKQRAVRDSSHMHLPEKTKLSFSHVEGAFFVLCFGLICSGVVFIFEICKKE